MKFRESNAAPACSEAMPCARSKRCRAYSLRCSIFASESIEIQVDNDLTADLPACNPAWLVCYASIRPVLGLRRFAAQHSWLRLGMLHIDGYAAATQHWFDSNGQARLNIVAGIERIEQLSARADPRCARLEPTMDVDRVRDVTVLLGYRRRLIEQILARRERRMKFAFSRRFGVGVDAHAGGQDWIAQRRHRSKPVASEQPTSGEVMHDL